MNEETDRLDSRRLVQLLEEVARRGGAAGALKAPGGGLKGLALLLSEPPGVYTSLGDWVDFTLPLSSDASETLDAVKDLIEENARLKSLSMTDALTGLYNPRYFQQRLVVEMERVGRTERPMTLLIVDLDHFKPVNDQYGHQVGDEVLKAVGAALKRTLRSVDVPIRYGGDEFAVILPDTSMKSAVKTAERLLDNLAQDPLVGRYGVSASIGLAAHRHYTREEADELIRRADKAMYQAKKSGGGRIYYFEEDRVKEEPTAVTLDEREALYLPFVDEDEVDDQTAD